MRSGSRSYASSEGQPRRQWRSQPGDTGGFTQFGGQSWHGQIGLWEARCDNGSLLIIDPEAHALGPSV